MSKGTEVIVKDFDMPFFSMVGFMVKSGLAAIPAVVMLALIWAFVGACAAGFLRS